MGITVSVPIANLNTITPQGSNDSQRRVRDNNSERDNQTVALRQITSHLSEMLEYANQLLDAEKEDYKLTCECLASEFECVIRSTEESIKKQKEQEDRLEKQFVKTHDDLIRLSTEFQNCKSRINHIDEKLSNVQSQLDELTQETANLKEEKIKIQRQIDEEEEKRKNAIRDLIPGHGLYEGIRTGNPKRAIPGYSLVDGLISVLHHDKEILQERLSQKENHLDSVQKNLEEITKMKAQEENKKSRDENELSQLSSTKETLDQQIKHIGRELVHFGNMLLELKKLPGKYQFLLIDIDALEDFISADLLDKSTVLGLITDVTQVQKTLKEFNAS